MSDKGKIFVDTIFKIFGGVYTHAIKAIAAQAPHEIKQAFTTLINEARKRSGLPQQQTLRLLVFLRDAIDHVIQSEGK